MCGNVRVAVLFALSSRDRNDFRDCLQRTVSSKWKPVARLRRKGENRDYKLNKIRMQAYYLPLLVTHFFPEK